MKSLSHLFLILLSYALWVPTAYADIPSIGTKNPQIGFLDGEDRAGSDSVTGILGRFWELVSTTVIFPLLGGLAVLFIVYAGIQYITARGNADQMKKSRQMIINVLLGIILLTATYTLLGLIIGAIRYLATQAA
jgi:hypothetical protein